MPWLLVVSGCGGLFEPNPGFVEETDSDPAAATGNDGGDDVDGLTVGGTDGTGGAGGDASADGVGGSSSEGDPACAPDEFELNDDQLNAAKLPNVSTTDAGGPLALRLEGVGAVDWFGFGASQPPTANAAVKATVSDPGLRVCVYIKCEPGGDPEALLDCGAGEPVTSLGNPGCCGLGQALSRHTCDGAADTNVYAWVRVSDAMDRDACLDYVLDYSFWPL